WAKQYFGAIARQPQTPPADISEPRQEKEKRATRTDPLPPPPAIAIGYHAPRRGTPEYLALGVIDQVLASGRDSWLYENLVQKRGLTGEIGSSMNELGSNFYIGGRRA